MARQAFRQYYKSTLESFLQKNRFVQSGMEVSPLFFQLKDLNGKLFRKQKLNGGDGPIECLFSKHLQLLSRLTVPLQYGEPVFQINIPTTNGGHQPVLFDLPDQNDFVFSYPLPDVPPHIESYEKGMGHLFLEFGDIFNEKTKVIPDGIRVNGNGHLTSLPFSHPASYEKWGSRTTKEIERLNYQPLHTIAGTEPVILMLAWHWALINKFCTLENAGGQKLLLDGFRLRKTSDWIVDSECRPSEVYEYLARICNVACKFCYLFGNPDRIAVGRGHKSISKNEIETRLKYWQPSKKQSLFHSQWEINEFLVDPKLPEILRSLRSSTPAPFFFITNGNPLIPRVIDLLEEVKPVNLIISANTFDGPLRSEIMGERVVQTRTALSCMQSLNEKQIPFGISLVAFPEISFEKLQESLEQLRALHPAFVRVNMPGFTASHPYKFEGDTDEVWSNAVKWVQAMRPKFPFPILAIPSNYEENNFYEIPHQPRIIGAVPGSPAAAAGIKPGDVIRKVNNYAVATRMDMLNLLMLCSGTITLEVERNGETMLIELDTSIPPQYPYTGHYFGKYMFPHGIAASGSLSISDASEIEAQIKKHKAKQVLIPTSIVMYRAAKEFIKEMLPAYENIIQLIVVKNDFLGGNIRIMDMATTGDIVSALQEHIAQTASRPDLVLVPSSGFNKFGRDISGKHWSDIERYLGIKTNLLINQFQFPY